MRGRKNCEMKWLSYPEWILQFNIGNWVQRSIYGAYGNANKGNDMSSLKDFQTDLSLVILDGYGIRDEEKDNAIKAAKTPPRQSF